jgi:hypothetical protein
MCRKHHFSLNFHLSATSAAIDAGENHGAPSIDLDGLSRPQNGTVDIGDYEYLPIQDCTHDSWV